MPTHAEWDILLSSVIALLLCGILGWEREAAGKAAGIRTHMLIGLAACLFVSLAEFLVMRPHPRLGALQYDPIRVLEAVVTGVSFLGAGTIFFAPKGSVHGLTTAAGILVTAAVGMMVGMKYYALAVGVTILTFLVLFVLGWIRDKCASEPKEETQAKSSPEGAAGAPDPEGSANVRQPG